MSICFLKNPVTIFGIFCELYFSILNSYKNYNVPISVQSGRSVWVHRMSAIIYSKIDCIDYETATVKPTEVL